MGIENDSLIAPDPASGHGLTMKLSRLAVRLMPPDEAIRTNPGQSHANDANGSVAASFVAALNFRTISMANNC
jgi:hypothetical protein